MYIYYLYYYLSFLDMLLICKFQLQPWMILSAIPMVFAFEGRELSLLAKVFRYSDIHIPLRFLMLVLTGGGLALCMELSG